MVAPLSLGMYKYFHPTHYRTCDYLSILGLKLNYVSKRGPRKEASLYWSPRDQIKCLVIQFMKDIMSRIHR